MKDERWFFLLALAVSYGGVQYLASSSYLGVHSEAAAAAADIGKNRFNTRSISSPKECILIMEAAPFGDLPNRVFVHSGGVGVYPAFVSLNEDGSHGGITMTFDYSISVYRISGEGVDAKFTLGSNKVCPDDRTSIFGPWVEGRLRGLMKQVGTLYNAQGASWNTCKPTPLHGVDSDIPAFEVENAASFTQCVRNAFEFEPYTSAVKLTDGDRCWGYKGRDVKLVGADEGSSCVVGVELIKGKGFGGNFIGLGTAHSPELCAEEANHVSAETINGITYDLSDGECSAVVGMTGVTDTDVNAFTVSSFVSHGTISEPFTTSSPPSTSETVTPPDMTISPTPTLPRPSAFAALTLGAVMSSAVLLSGAFLAASHLWTAKMQGAASSTQDIRRFSCVRDTILGEGIDRVNAVKFRPYQDEEGEPYQKNENLTVDKEPVAQFGGVLHSAPDGMTPPDPSAAGCFSTIAPAGPLTPQDGCFATPTTTSKFVFSGRH